MHDFCFLSQEKFCEKKFWCEKRFRRKPAIHTSCPGMIGRCYVLYSGSSSCLSRGNLTSKRDPIPIWLSTRIDPPCACTIHCVMERPRPVPPGTAPGACAS